MLFFSSLATKLIVKIDKMTNIGLFKIVIEYNTPVNIRTWLGGLFYKTIRYYFRRIYCSSHSTCEKCASKNECLYYYIFEDTKSNWSNQPRTRPLIFIPPFLQNPVVQKPKFQLDIKCLCFTDPIHTIPYIVVTLNEMGKHGFPQTKEKALNIFYIKEIQDLVSSKIIYDGTSFFYKNITKLNILDAKECKKTNLIVTFNTPIVTNRFPINLEILLKKVRNRLLYFENEFGSKTRLP